MSTARDSMEDQIRHTLHTVAQTVTEASQPQAAPGAVQDRARGGRRRRWSLIVGAGAVAVPLTLAAAAFVRSGPEYVDTIPANTIIVEGEIDGDRYLLVETRRTECGEPVPGVELVEEDENLLGSEWNTIGEQYGERSGDACSLDTSRYLANPALYNDGGTTVGNSFVWLWAVHPDVTAVRITADGSSKDLPIYAIDGAGYALYEVPEGLTTYTAELLIGDYVVPGSTELQRVPVPR
ncbi:MAG: hypothetical protein WKF76_04835 [Nocardioidaceae bacterium]